MAVVFSREIVPGVYPGNARTIERFQKVTVGLIDQGSKERIVWYAEGTAEPDNQ